MLFQALHLVSTATSTKLAAAVCEYQVVANPESGFQAMLEPKRFLLSGWSVRLPHHCQHLVLLP
jgi:hypothetical protein